MTSKGKNNRISVNGWGLLGKTGYTHSRSTRFEIIIECFLVNESYDMFEINEILYSFGQPLPGQ